MRPTQIAYLALLGLGVALPLRRFAEWFMANGIDLAAFRAALTANIAAAGMTTSVIIVSTAAVVFMISEAAARQDPRSLVAVPCTILLGPAVGLPLYLFLRLRPLG